MRIYEEISVNDFRDRAWSGAVDTLDALTDDQVETIFEYLEDSTSEEGMDLTDLNDFFRFENDTIAEWLGFSSWEQLAKRGDRGDEFFDDTDISIRITHGTEGVDDDSSIDDMLSDAKDECEGEYWVSDEADEDYDDDEEKYTGSVIVDVSEAMLEWLDDNGVAYQKLS